MDNVVPSEDAEWELVRTGVLLPDPTSKVRRDCRSHWTLERFLSPCCLVLASYGVCRGESKMISEDGRDTRLNDGISEVVSCATPSPSCQNE